MNPITGTSRSTINVNGKYPSEPALSTALIHTTCVPPGKRFVFNEKFHPALILPGAVDETEDIFVNEYLVREGYARSSTYPPDVKFQNQFKEAEKEARENSKGLWNSCQK